MKAIQQTVEQAVDAVFGIDTVVTLTRPDVKFGDFATNVALQIAGKVGKSPRDIAAMLIEKMQSNDAITEATVAGPGFINLRLSDSAVANMLASSTTIQQALTGKVIVAEYSDPNPFKVLHAGHLYTSIVGDAIANVLQAAGADVHRVNFGGDVGLHVGKTMWAILDTLAGEAVNEATAKEKLSTIGSLALDERSMWLAEQYIKGNNAYDENEKTKEKIIALNKRIYAVNASSDDQSDLGYIYFTCRQWSYEYFDAFYARIGTSFEKYYPESAVANLGLATVKEQLARGVFKESNGAIVFDGEAHGLHTRVFINSEGLPTYEAKDVGLIMQKKRDYNFDASLVITGNEQEQYMAVVLKAIEQFAPDLAHVTRHVTHGIVKLAGGVKMSSRKGNILRAVDVLDVAAEANNKTTGKDDERVVLGAVKYAFLKQRIGGDIVYDPNESVSLQGNSGPYLQYAYARAYSILQKSNSTRKQLQDFTPGERMLACKIAEFSEAVDKVLYEYMPHHICTYLYELTQVFNRFYENEKVIGSDREAERLSLLEHYCAALKMGLQLLGIQAPESM